MLSLRVGRALEKIAHAVTFFDLEALLLFRTAVAVPAGAQTAGVDSRLVRILLEGCLTILAVMLL